MGWRWQAALLLACAALATTPAAQEEPPHGWAHAAACSATKRRFAWWFHSDEKMSNVTAALKRLSDASGARVGSLQSVRKRLSVKVDDVATVGMPRTDSRSDVFVDGTTVLHRTAESYVSFNVDFSNRPYQPQAQLYHANVSDPALRTLVSAMSPAVLRLGGGAAGTTIYDVPGSSHLSVNGEGQRCAPVDAGQLPWDSSANSFECRSSAKCGWPCGILSTRRIEEWLEFADATNLSLSFDLSPLYGTTYSKLKTGLFNCSNAEALIRYARMHNWRLFSFEFGNEMSCLHCGKTLADTYIWLADLIRTLWRNSSLPRPLLIGPSSDSCGQPAFEQSFFGQLKARGRLDSSLDAYVYHAYGGQHPCPQCSGNELAKCCASFYPDSPPCNATGCDPKTQCFKWSGSNPVPPQSQVTCLRTKLRDALTLDKYFGGQVFERTWGGVLRQVGFGGEVWIGESAARAGGGMPGITDSFVSGFYYLDTLGSLARAGHSVFLRQALMGSWYGLVQPTPLNSTAKFQPAPDFWSGLLFKRTMGVKVLDAGPSNATASTSLRTYAHCAKGREDGSVTVMFLNLQANTSLRVGFIAGIRSLSPRLEWHLAPSAPGDAALSSQEILLNGRRLALARSGTMPTLKPRKVSGNGALVLAPSSFTFVTLLGAQASACAAKSDD